MKKYLSILLILCICLTACTTTNQATSTSEKSQSDTTSGEAVQSGQEEKAAKAPDTSKPEGTLEVHYIDVGQGDATLIKCGSHAMLIDGGNNNKGTTVQLYLKKQGVESLDYVIGTHPDADHIGGLDVIVYKYNCEKVIMPDYEKDTRTYQELVDVIHDKNMKITYPVVGEQYALGEAEFTIIAPNSNSYGGNANDYSVAILLEYGKNRFLFTGDAEEASETEMLSNGIELSADVYKVAHHGSRSASTQEFLNAVRPKYAVISCGEENSYGHPHAEVLNRLRSMGVEVFRTDEQGSIIASSDGENITWNCSATDSWQSGEQTESDRENAEDENPGDENSGNAISDAVTSEQTTYVLNTNTKKFHRETCGSVSQIKEENFQKVQMSREELEQSGYSPCKNCNP
ncbi:MAG: MBL fold metallo-hydrolase [Lachnospiraceae bacterium]|nr:MBL fold metallo-hydrolase [Lachnospiraceae bacterium]MEE0512306.1 ComEC/Rec2 family competence protein [Lachnospiraceae bacterium]